MASTIRHCDGAEAQNLDWVVNTQGTPTADLTNPATGNAAYLLEGGATPEQIGLPLETNGLLANRNTITDSHLVIGFKCRFADTTPGTTYAFMQVLNTTPSVVLNLELEDDGDLVLRDEAGTALLTVTNPFTVDVYTTIEVVFERDLVNSDWEVFLDGVTKGSGANGDFAVSGVNPDLVRFSAGGAAADDVLIDDYYVKSATTLGDATPEANSDGTIEVFVFQAGSGATTEGTLDTGSVTDIDDLPRLDASLIKHDPNAASWLAHTDAASAEGNAGPNGNAIIDGDSNIKMAVWDHRLRRTNGSNPDALDQSWGNTSDSIKFSNRDSDLTVALQNFFVSSDDQAFAVPTSSEYFRYGIRKSGAGGRDIWCSNILVQVLHVPTSAPSVTITAVLAEAPAAALVPTITSVEIVSIAAALATADAAALAAAIQIAATISAELATADAAGLIPAIATVEIVSVVGAVAEAPAAVLPPTITSAQIVLISAAIATSDAAALVAAIQIATTISGELATADAVVLIPVITAISGGDVTITAVLATADAAALVPAVTAIQIVSITAALATADAAALPAAIQIAIVISGELATATAAAGAASITSVEIASIAAVLATATAAALPPIITSQQVVNIAAALATANAAVLAADIQIATTINAVVAEALADALAPVVQIATVINAALATASADALPAVITTVGVVNAIIAAVVAEASADVLPATITAIFVRPILIDGRWAVIITVNGRWDTIVNAEGRWDPPITTEGRT